MSTFVIQFSRAASQPRMGTDGYTEDSISNGIIFEDLAEEEMVPGSTQKQMLESLVEDVKSLKALKQEKPHWAQTWMPSVTSVAALVVAILAWLQPQHKQVTDAAADEHLRQVIGSEFDKRHFDQLSADVAELKGRVEQMKWNKENKAQPALHKLANLPQAQFEQRLPELAKVLDQGIAARLLMEAGTYHALQAKLISSPASAPAYWPAAAALIGSRAQAYPSESGLQNCFDEFKRYIPAEPHVAGQPFVHEQFFGNCELDIDDFPRYLRSGFAKSLTDGSDSAGSVIRFHLRNGVVVYRGGPLIPFASLECANCTYRFSVPSIPPTGGQRIIKKLLATNERTVFLQGSGTGSEQPG